MKIDPEKCISCLECIDICPVNAIFESDEVTEIHQDDCVECTECLKSEVCPEGAIYMPEESQKYPRLIRTLFSNPRAQWPRAIAGFGRGTQEMKTNDVTGRYGRGEYGIGVEFGRPGIGTRITEIEKVSTVLAQQPGIHFEEENPVIYLLMEDIKTGKIKPEFLQEKILSGILEFSITEGLLEDVMAKLLPVLETVDTVVSLALISRFSEDGTLPVIEKLQQLGLSPHPNAKINLGLGQPFVD
jgi:NAD-dependent dihydropyrimidine dehydrogenase PreA subunit